MSRLVLVITALALAAPARANVGRASFPGTRASEPNGLHDVAIEREELGFDLRPLADGREVRVSAVYHLENHGTTTANAPLVFVSGTAIGDFEVTFDGARVTGNRTFDSLPPAWSAPLTTPALDGGGSLGYETEGHGAVAFTLAIPPGRHQLAVQYAAVAQMNRSRHGGTLLYQLGYVLSPARDWGSFGTLEVSVSVPAGWHVATSPALARTGDTLRAKFPALPADTIGITAQAPVGMLHEILQYVLPLLALAVLVLGGYVLFAIGRARRRDATNLRALWPVSLPASVVWAIAIAVTGGLAAMRSEVALPAHQAAAYGYGNALGAAFAILVAILAIPVGVLIARSANKIT